MPDVLGPELLSNGNFELSTGVQGGSLAGPGWNTSYVACGPNLFAAPCGAARWAYFTTNAGQVTGGAASAIPVIGTRSFAVNVGPNTAVPIIEWVNIPLINGQRYRLQVTSAIMVAPFSIAIRIDGGAQGNFPVTPPGATMQWVPTATDFTFAGPTGNYAVGLYSNTGAAGGNDLTFDNISLRTLTFVEGSVPCGCCPVGQACAITGVLFTGVAETQAAAGWTPISLNLTIDGITNTATLSGYNSPAGAAIAPNVEVTYTVTPTNGVRGLFLWNQGGGNLNDADGLGSFVADFYSGATLLTSFNATGINGGARQSLLFPGNLILDGVDRVVLRNLGKQLASGAAPLWRELQLAAIRPVFSCRTGTTLRWFDTNSVEVQAADVTPCDATVAPLQVVNLLMTGTALGDGGGDSENICNVVPTPTSMVGFVASGPGCFDPATAPPNTMTWASVSSVEAEYSAGTAPAQTGAALLSFSAPSIGTVTWAANGTKMTVGESRLSNPLTGGGRARITLLAGAPAGSTISMDGGANLRFGANPVGSAPPTTPIRFRLEFFA